MRSRSSDWLSALGIAIVGLAGACSSADGSGDSGADVSGDVCPGTEPWPEGTQTCRSDAECDASSYCATQMSGNTCGGCTPTFEGCSVDDDCGNGLCEPYDVPQGPCDCEPSMVCVANCNDAGCGDGFTCELDGHCTPISCDAGYDCPDDSVCDLLAEGSDPHGCIPAPCDAGYACGEDEVCDAGAPGEDAHGCRPLHCMEGFDCGMNHRCEATPSGNGCLSLTCTGDGDCDCGACLNGVCGPRIGACLGYPS